MAGTCAEVTSAPPEEPSGPPPGGKRIVPGDSGELHTTTTFAVLGCLQAVNLCAALFFLLVVVAQMRSLTTRQTWGFFLSMMVAFAGMYFFVAIVIDHACNSTDSRLQLPAFQFPTAWNTNATGAAHQRGPRRSRLQSCLHA